MKFLVYEALFCDKSNIFLSFNINKFYYFIKIYRKIKNYNYI